MNIGTNEREHPNSSPINSPSPRQMNSPMVEGQYRQDSLELYPNLSPVPSPGGASPTAAGVAHRLDRPLDDRLHNRRPSDEASIILRKISSSEAPPSFALYNMMPGPGMRGPMDSHNYDDLPRIQTLGLGDTGRMLTALSDSYLPNMALDPRNTSDFFLMDEGSRRLASPEEMLIPPLSTLDRHPSAPQLASMLASSVDNKASEVMVNINESMPMRKRSWSMPANGPLRPGMAPQISISSPDDNMGQCESSIASISIYSIVSLQQHHPFILSITCPVACFLNLNY